MTNEIQNGRRMLTHLSVVGSFTTSPPGYVRRPSFWLRLLNERFLRVRLQDSAGLDASRNSAVIGRTGLATATLIEGDPMKTGQATMQVFEPEWENEGQAVMHAAMMVAIYGGSAVLVLLALYFIFF